MCISKYVNVFGIQEKEDDSKDRIDQDQPRLEQTLLVMETISPRDPPRDPPRDNRDIILDVTLFAENLAEVSY